jgi:hypothetical protein
MKDGILLVLLTLCETRTATVRLYVTPTVGAKLHCPGPLIGEGHTDHLSAPVQSINSQGNTGSTFNRS